MSYSPNFVLIFFIHLLGITPLIYAIDPPSDISVSFDADRNKIDIIANIPGGLGADDSCHAILVSDLSTSLSGAYETGSALPQSDGPAISFSQKNSTLAVFLGNQAIERYFVAVKVSRLVNGNRIHSPWKIYADNSTGLPISISTSHGIYKENIFHRARCIDERNSHKIIIDFTFSLPTSNASGCKFKLFKNNIELLNVDNLGTVSGKSDIQNAMQDTVGINSALILKRENNGSYFYNIYQTVNITPADTISATIISSDGSVIDTVHEKVRIFSDSSYMNIVSTISALTYMADGTSDPFFPAPFQPMADSVKANLLIAAMIDQSLAHNSPKPSNTELAQGIYTNYMQFMDNIARNWSSVGAAGRGIQRLRSMHNLVLDQNNGGIIDPVAVDNRGTCFERISQQQEQKRNNYAFYNGYSRIKWELTRPEYGSTGSGTGIMFRVSENIALFGARIEDGLVSFDTLPFLQGNQYRRIIYKADDAILNRLSHESQGIWAKGIAGTGDAKFYIGIEPVRLPVTVIDSVAKIDSAFSLDSENKSTGDPEGKIIGGAEGNILKIYALGNTMDENSIIENTDESHLFLHGQKRKAVFDRTFLAPGCAVNFQITGNEQYRDKIVLEDITDSAVILHDTSLIPAGCLSVLAMFSVNGTPAAAFIKEISSHKLILRDAVDGKLFLDTYIPKKHKGEYLSDLEKIPVNVETNPSAWLSADNLTTSKVKIRWDGGLTVFDRFYSQMLPSETNTFDGGSLGRKHLHFDQWLSFKPYFLESSVLHLSTNKAGENKISFSINTGSFFKPEVLKEEVLLTGNRVSFTEHENQINGFDKVENSDIDYISIDGNYGETRVYVEIEPFKEGKFWAVSSDPSLIKINGVGEKMINEEREELLIKVQKIVETETPSKIEIRVGPSGKLLKSLEVMVYKRKYVQKIHLDRITDLSSPKTEIPEIVNSPDILNEINSYYRQAVVNIGTITGFKDNDTCAINFDKNLNGALDYYYDGENPEFSVVKTLFPTGQINIAQIKNLKEAWRLDPATVSLPEKTKTIKLQGVSYLDVNSWYYFGKQDGLTELVYIIEKSIETHTIKVKTPLNNSYDNSDGKVELFRSIAGLSSNPILVTQGSNHIAFTIGHELLHKAVFGDLLDVSEDDNLMYYIRKRDNIGKLRYRKQTFHYPDHEDKSGFDQWSNINREDIVESEGGL